MNYGVAATTKRVSDESWVVSAGHIVLEIFNIYLRVVYIFYWWVWRIAHGMKASKCVW